MSNTITYPGDCTGFDPERILGPDLHGAYYRQISASYDGERTVIQLRPIAPSDLKAMVDDDRERTFAKLAALQRIYGLFGGPQ